MISERERETKREKEGEEILFHSLRNVIYKKTNSIFNCVITN